MTPLEIAFMNTIEMSYNAVKVIILGIIILSIPIAWTHFKCKLGFHSYRTRSAKNCNGYWEVEGKCIRCGHIINTRRKDPDLCRTW